MVKIKVERNVAAGYASAQVAYDVIVYPDSGREFLRYHFIVRVNVVVGGQQVEQVDFSIPFKKGEIHSKWPDRCVRKCLNHRQRCSLSLFDGLRFHIVSENLYPSARGNYTDALKINGFLLDRNLLGFNRLNDFSRSNFFAFWIPKKV